MYIKITHTKNRVTTSFHGGLDHFKDRSFFVTYTVYTYHFGHIFKDNKKLLFNDDGSPTPRAQQILGHTPMNRMGDAGELVGAAIFLASHAASSFVTGTDIRVDGGFLSQTI